MSAGAVQPLRADLFQHFHAPATQVFSQGSPHKHFLASDSQKDLREIRHLDVSLYM